MTRSTSGTKALWSRSEQLQQLIFPHLVRPVAPDCFSRQTLHVLNSEFGSAQLWRACLKRVLIYYQRTLSVLFPECQCTRNGQCEDGVSGTGHCFCDAGYSGIQCETQLSVIPVCDPPCHMNAVCRQRNQCQCRSEYYGSGYSCTGRYSHSLVYLVKW